MQLESFYIEGLFGHYDHLVDFAAKSTKADGHSSPTIIVIHGENGVGKTTTLRMLHGALQLDFDMFRQAPFRKATLRFNNGKFLQIEHVSSGDEQALSVTFDGHHAKLSPLEPGPAHVQDRKKVAAFRKHFFDITEGITCEMLNPSGHRGAGGSGRPDADRVDRQLAAARLRGAPYRPAQHDDDFDPFLFRDRLHAADNVLSTKIRSFMREAQINVRGFFSFGESDVFPTILKKLMQDIPATPDALLAKLRSIKEGEELHKSLGLAPEKWHIEPISQAMNASPSKEAVAVTAAYTDTLDARFRERDLVATRLTDFERAMNSFFVDKRLKVGLGGFRVHSKGGEQLSESQLSSGEYNLLFLMVHATITRRRGTVIIIDEPELSMHVRWQRMLLPALFRCARGAQPQFIIATHSPDIASGFPDALVAFGRGIV
jgi:predicted ATPase